LGPANNAAVFGRLDIAWLRCILVERKVCPRAVIVAEVAAQTTTEVLLVEDDHVVEQLAADGANYALGEGVLPGRARCGEDLGDAHALHPSAKVDAVCAISIAEEKARRRVIGKGLDNLLRCPGGSWGIGDLEVRNLPATMQEDHEHVEHSEGRLWTAGDRW